jgi:triosephosphate isomerase (TIM)
MRYQPWIVGNWKMYKTSLEARSFISALAGGISSSGRRICLAVPFTALEGAAEAAEGTAIEIGAQNMHDQLEGAFTGEISAPMLKSSGARFVLLGHSERRQHFFESNPFIHSKLLSALKCGLTPILCVGELSHEREGGKHEEVLKLQLSECLKEITPSEALRVVIAYEPVWAIGTGKTATPEIAQATHKAIRLWLEERFGKEASDKIPLLYGGSVKPDNIEKLMSQADIDGVLVGGASLDVKSFAQIVNY